MLNLLKSIVDTIRFVLDFAIHTIQSLLYFLIKIPSYVAFFAQSFDILPAVIIPFAIASMYIYILYFIMARDK